MVETQVKFVVVGHHKRIDAAKELCGILDAHMLIDYEDHGANWNHRRALEWAKEQGCHVVVLEDDALPVEGFISSVYDWIERYPDSLISFYLGTGRPPQYQLEIASKLIAADKSRAEFITLTRLIHGVCYCVPPKHIQK
ncbi:TPA: hypothetical protein ACTYJK_004747, partial [Enterobacter hormaechei]